MSARPQRRKSNLSRLSPADPAPETTAPTPAAEPTGPAPTPATPEAPAVGEVRRKFRHKVSFYQDEDDTARVRAAILHTNHLEGPRSLSEFITRAVMAEVNRLEEKYNDGQPWPGVGARELPQGRPMGS
ncbi:hypothetical protein V2J52_16625 [Georgenia sp. MJ173]|uniref:ParB family protein n=1 Tax=Georgenia sunbinii TaxID=3117728 RepID=UPI002F2655CE